MKRVKSLKVKAINEARSWIIPELVKGDLEDVFCIQVRNGTGLTTNFSIKSNLITDDFNFVLDGALQDIWEAELKYVEERPQAERCVVRPASGQDTIDIHILRIRHKFSFDTRWRSSEQTHYIKF